MGSIQLNRNIKNAMNKSVNSRWSYNKRIPQLVSYTCRMKNMKRKFDNLNKDVNKILSIPFQIYKRSINIYHNRSMSCYNIATNWRNNCNGVKITGRIELNNIRSIDPNCKGNNHLHSNYPKIKITFNKMMRQEWRKN